MSKWDRQKGFNLTRALSETDGLFVELAGPTPEVHGYSTFRIDFKKLPKKVFISNLKREELFYRGTEREYVHTNIMDVQLDANHLPFKNDSLGAVFVSYLDRDINDKAKTILTTATEAHRTLKDGGLLIWQGLEENEIEQNQKIGLEPVSVGKHVLFKGLTFGVFMKQGATSPSS